MRAEDFVVVVRDASLRSRGLILPEDLNLTAALRHNNVGVWSLTLPAEHRMAAVLAETGAGLIVSVPGPAGVPVTLFSGSASQPLRTVAANSPGRGTFTFRGFTDSEVLGDPATFPDPSNPNATTQTAATDKRTGPAESLLHGYTSDNLGPTAPSPRRNPLIVMGANGARGGTVTHEFRFKPLGAALAEIAAASGLGFRVVQVEAALEFQTFVPVDRSGIVRMSVENGGLEGFEIETSAPAVTHVLVLGQGEGADRQVVEVTTPALELWSAATGRRIERVLDRRDTADVDVLTSTGLAYLAENGGTAAALRVRPVGDTRQQLGKDWNLGDTVAVIVDGQEPTAVITEVAFTVKPDGVKVAATVGDPAGYQGPAQATTRLTAVERKVQQLTTSEGAAGSAAGSVTATPDTLALRDALGRTQVADPVADDDAANKGYVDGAIVPAQYWVASPVGVPLHWPFTSAIPAGFTEYDGGVESQAAMPALYAVLGTQFNTGGEGAGNFRKPDYRRMVPAGYKSGDAVFGAAIGSTVGAATHSHGTSALVAAIYAGYWKTRNAVAAWTATNSGGVTAPGANSTTNNPAAAIEGTTDAASSVQPSMLGRWIARYETVTLTPSGSTASITATAATVALRDASGRSQFATPAAAADAATKGYVDQGYHLGAVLYFTSSGTFTKASYPWARAVRVRVQGAGGAGGGCAATSGSNYSVGAGGGGGGYAEALITDVAAMASSVTVTVGAGGAGSSGGAGGTGGASSFGAYAAAGGGAGGAYKIADVYAPYNSPGIGGVGTAGDLRIAGCGGSPAVGNSTLGTGGTGGAAHLGGGAPASGTGAGGASMVGTAGGNYGGGGSGAYACTGGAAKAGGAGAPGIVIVEVFA